MCYKDSDFVSRYAKVARLFSLYLCFFTNLAVKLCRHPKFCEGMGLQGAGTIGMAAATFGLIAGSMIGGPLAERIIRKKLTHEQMQPQDDEIDPAMAGIESDEASPTGRKKRVSTNMQSAE